MALFQGYVRKRDVAIKKSLQMIFTRPMFVFPSFPKELLFDVEEEKDDEAEVDETKPTPTHPTIEEKATKRPQKDEEKTESVIIETNHDRE